MGGFNSAGAFYRVFAVRICLRCFMPQILGWKTSQLLLWLLIFFDPTRMARVAELGLCQCSAVKHMEGLCPVLPLAYPYCMCNVAAVCAIMCHLCFWQQVCHGFIGRLALGTTAIWLPNRGLLVGCDHSLLCSTWALSQRNLYASLQVLNPQHYDPSHQASWVQLPVKIIHVGGFDRVRGSLQRIVCIVLPDAIPFWWNVF